MKLELRMRIITKPNIKQKYPKERIKLYFCLLVTSLPEIRAVRTSEDNGRVLLFCNTYRVLVAGSVNKNKKINKNK